MQMTMNESKVKVGTFRKYITWKHTCSKNCPPDSLNFLQKHKTLFQRSILKSKKTELQKYRAYLSMKSCRKQQEERKSLQPKKTSS